MSISRRQLLLGRLFGGRDPEPAPVSAPAALDIHWFDPTAAEEPAIVVTPGPGEDLVARMLPFDCLVGRGSLCSTCSEVCPEPGAIKVGVGVPKIVAEPCTGCGLCVQRCPAPGGAIVMGPRHP